MRLVVRGMMMKRIFFESAVVLLLSGLAGTIEAASHTTSTPPAQTATDVIDGEVRKIDRDARKITLRHGEIKQLDMPAMTMVFQVKDPAMLDRLKAGDKVRFRAEGSGGAFTITEIELAN